MNKVVFIFLLVFFASCSSFNKEEKEVSDIKKAVKLANKEITEHTDLEIDRALDRIKQEVNGRIWEADTTLDAKLNVIIESLIEKERELSEKAKVKDEELKNKITDIYALIMFSFIFSGAALILGGLGLFFYKSRNKEKNISQIKDIVFNDIDFNDVMRKEIRRCVEKQISAYASKNSNLSKNDIEIIVETYIRSSNFSAYLEQLIFSIDKSSIENKTESKLNNIEQQSICTNLYQIFAKESNSMVLSNLQSTYQKGKSLYKLTMIDANANSADITLCIDQDEVKQRVIKFDNQYLEPICSVMRTSSEPNEVIIKSTGFAERNGDEWKVIKPIIVEIK